MFKFENLRTRDNPEVFSNYQNPTAMSSNISSRTSTMFKEVLSIILVV